VDFYAVYIMEAHPTDIWQMSSNIRDKVLFHTPQNEAERTAIADACVRTLGIRFPAVVDGLDNRVEQAYTGWPDRLYLITPDGRIQFKTEAGPFGFEPKELAAALQKKIGS
jgi:Iodothyronine deiodinase